MGVSRGSGPGWLRRGLLGVGCLAAAIVVGSASEPAGAAPAPVCGATGCTVTFSFTAAAQSWTVPPGVTEATFDVFGAQGADSPTDFGGTGGETTATFGVAAGDVFQVMVGGAGMASLRGSDGGFNGGGDGGRFSGGGASDVRAGNCAADSSCGLDDRIVVAGGGGGAGSDGGAGGAGGGVTGGDGTGPLAGTGGTQTAGGARGFSGAGDGAFGVGGNGGTIPPDGGGGGGGGWYGGGGGVAVSGGGGGSGHVDKSTIASSMSSGVRSGDGEVIVTYPVPVAAAPLVMTTPANDLAATTATLNGVVDPEGSSTSYYFEYGLEATYRWTTGPQEAEPGTDLVLAQASVTGLEPGKEYHFRLVAHNDFGTTEGPDRSFTTAAAAVVPAPTATTSPASGVSTTGATLNGVVNPQGVAASYHFEYGTSSGSYESSTPDQSAGSGTAGVAVSAPLTGLQPGQTYHFRIVATSTGGTADGDDAHFTTDAVSAPANLAPDPDFEQSPDSYFTNGPGQFSWASDQAHSGEHSLKIVGSGGGLSRWLSHTPAIPVTAGSYTACAYLKTQGVNTAAYLAVNYWTAGGSYIPATVNTPTRASGDSDWTQVCVTTQAPAGAATLRLEFRLPDRGSLWIDDTSVTRTP